LEFLQDFRLRPRDQIKATFIPDNDTNSDDDLGEFKLDIKGLWVDTILYEIPLLALTSETYFRFMDTDWTYDGQEEQAFAKGMKLLEAGCVVSEFGTRRRRDYHTQALVFRGLVKAKKEGEKRGLPGKISGTSNVHLAMRFGIPPIGTVAHEWYMGIAAITGDYENANETALRYWAGCFGEGVLSVALTDTFGTPAFLKAFSKEMPLTTVAVAGAAATSAPNTSSTTSTQDSLASTEPPLGAPVPKDIMQEAGKPRTYAQSYQGLRQDSGDPLVFIKTVREFYLSHGLDTKGKVLVFSDSLSSVEQCVKYKKASEEAGFVPTFGIGTWMTNSFARSDGTPSTPINIVIKISSANGRPAIKLSDDMGGKGTGDKDVVAKVKEMVSINYSLFYKFPLLSPYPLRTVNSMLMYPTAWIRREILGRWG
jgi:nicotinate phosphoribosyltransferase